MQPLCESGQEGEVCPIAQRARDRMGGNAELEAEHCTDPRGEQDVAAQCCVFDATDLGMRDTDDRTKGALTQA